MAVQELDDTARLGALSRVGQLLDEAVDLADGSGETLIAAHIAQAIHSLDERITRIRSGPTPGDPGRTERGGGMLGG